MGKEIEIDLLQHIDMLKASEYRKHKETMGQAKALEDKLKELIDGPINAAIKETSKGYADINVADGIDVMHVNAVNTSLLIGFLDKGIIRLAMYFYNGVTQLARYERYVVWNTVIRIESRKHDDMYLKLEFSRKDG